MFKVLGSQSKMCDGTTRREVLQVGALSALGLSLSQLAMADGRESQLEGSAKAVILVNLIGGPSHIDMFDMKPEAPVEIRGEFSPIDTSVAGLQVCEHLPLTARTMHLSTLIRTHTHLYNTHSPYNMLTGYSGPVIVDNVAKLTDHPSIGAVMHHAGLRSQDVPTYVWMPSHPGHSQGKHRAGPYGGFLGRQYDPAFTAYEARFEEETAGRNAHVNPPTPLAEPKMPLLDQLPPITLDRLNGRRSLLQQLGDQITALDRSAVARNLDDNRHQAYDLLTSDKTRRAFDLSKEPQQVRERYGKNLFGSCMLTARRLVEAGVRFVGVTTESTLDGKIGAGQWDTHSNNFRLLKNFNLPILDQNYTALIEDLDARGMLASTLVVVMGEMGRTPKVNKNAGGRDHWTQCGFILLTGGGVKRGYVHGKSDSHAGWPIDGSVSSADHVATIYTLVGLDPHQTVTDRSGNAVPIGLHGRAVREVIA
ncbi:MAG: DUF1501 domain-containing protein [Planctomycetota bacterium]|nr:DUF1501 domain-containing protein [Planctomycetota bacterium]